MKKCTQKGWSKYDFIDFQMRLPWLYITIQKQAKPDHLFVFKVKYQFRNRFIWTVLLLAKTKNKNYELECQCSADGQTYTLTAGGDGILDDN